LVYYKQVLQALKKQLESEENKRKVIEVIQRMYTPMLCLSFPEDSLHILQQGESLCLELGDEKALAFCYGIMSRLYFYKGESHLAIEYGEKGYWQAEKVEDLDSMVQASSYLLPVYLMRGQMFKLMRVASKAIPLMEETQRQKDFFNLPYIPYAQCCSQLGMALAYLGNFDEGRMYCEKGLSEATETGDLYTLGLTAYFFGWFWLLKGDGKKAIEHVKNSIQSFEAADYPMMLGLSWSLLGYGYYYLGDLETARKHCQKGLEIHPEQIRRAEELILKGMEIMRELDLKPYLALGYSWLGECFENAGQKDKAVENLKTAEEMFKEMGTYYYLARTHAIYADLYKKEGDKSKAKENMNKAIEIFNECGADGWVKKYEEELASLS